MHRDASPGGVPTSLNRPLPPIAENFPRELTARAQWLVWRSIEGDKKPFSVKTHALCDPTDSANWSTFAEAQAATLLGDYDGFGFALANDGLVGVDLDKCVLNGAPSPAAVALLEHLRPAYVELSPSGNGLRAFGFGELLQSGASGLIDGLKAEFYSGGRYLTVTGRALKVGALSPLHDFAGTAERFRAAGAATKEGSPGDRHAQRITNILAGDILHDSLRDEAAALADGGMPADAIEAVLRGLMEASDAPHDERWIARCREIPRLVRTAVEKYAALGFSDAVDITAPDATRYKRLTGADLRALPPASWVIKTVLPRAGLAAVFGPSGSGKSFLAFDMAAAIAEERPWFECRVKPAEVIYAALEGEAGFKQRAAAWEHEKGRPLPAAMGLILQPIKITEAQDIADLVAIVPPGAVVFIDTLNRAAPEADENSSSDMGRILQGAKTLQHMTGGLVVLIHHTGKDTTKGLRGHSSLHAALDAAVEVSRSGDQREWRIAKSKEGRDGFGQCFMLEVVVLGRDEDGDVVTSCVVRPAERLPDAARPLTPTQQEAMSAWYAARGTGTGGVQRDAWRAAFYSACTAQTDDAKRKAFDRAVKSLTDLGTVCERGKTYLLGDFESA